MTLKEKKLYAWQHMFFLAMKGTKSNQLVRSDGST